jgi:hypothetical protein
MAGILIRTADYNYISHHPGNHLIQQQYLTGISLILYQFVFRTTRIILRSLNLVKTLAPPTLL